MNGNIHTGSVFAGDMVDSIGVKLDIHRLAWLHPNAPIKKVWSAAFGLAFLINTDTQDLCDAVGRILEV